MNLVTRAQATRVLAAVRKFTGNPEAALYEPGFHASGWTIALEGDYDWPLRFVEAQHTNPTLSEDLFIEPVNGWALGIYPA